jgi:hypothetical protein
MKKIVGSGLVMMLCAANVFAQSPWAKGKGEGYVQVGYNLILPTNLIFSNNTEFKYMNRKVYDNNIQAYGEYGIMDKLSISVVANAKYVATGGIETIDTDVPLAQRPPALVLPAGKKLGLGNSYLGAKYQFLGGSWAASGNLNVMLPAQKADSITALATGFNCFAVAPSVSVGTAKDKFYLFANAGINLRTGAFSHEWAATVEYGYKIKKAYIMANAHARYNFNNQPAPEFLHTGLGLNRQNYVAFGIKAFIPFTDNLGVNLSAFGAVAGNNVQAAPSFGASVFYKW